MSKPPKRKKYYETAGFWILLSFCFLVAMVALFEGIVFIKNGGKISDNSNALKVGFLFLAISVFLFVRQAKDSWRDNEERKKQVQYQNLVNQVRFLESDVSQEEQFSERAETISAFLLSWDTMMSDLKHLREYDKSLVFNGCGADGLIIQKQNDFQWKLRDAIERDKLKRLKQIRYDYKNSKEHQAREYQMFCASIQENYDRLSDETREFADNAANEIYDASKLTIPKIVLFEKHENAAPLHVADAIETDRPLSEIEGMEGHQFEYWCADLLRECGFYNVSVTQGSGDQGVDVLAEKDGIRYAIQCKSYSSPLGNRPIQEVHTGKQFYNCHVGVVMTNNHFTAGAVEAAKRTNTLLWDRDTIEKMINSTKKAKNMCPNCGSKLSGSEKYCTCCGAKIPT